MLKHRSRKNYHSKYPLSLTLELPIQFICPQKYSNAHIFLQIINNKSIRKINFRGRTSQSILNPSTQFVERQIVRTVTILSTNIWH